MNLSVLIKIMIVATVVMIVQIFIPVIHINGLEMTPDIIIIFLVYIGYYYGRFEAIMMGFLLGLIQDFGTQLELIGIMAFIKSLIGYCLGSMALYRSIWHRNFRIFFIFFIFTLHFYIYHYIKLYGTSISNILFFKIILIQTILCFFILILFDKSIMKNGVLK